MQNVTNVASLTLTHYEFLTVIEGHQPSLTGDHTHLSDLIYIDERVPVNAAKQAAAKTLFQCFEILSSQIALFADENSTTSPAA